MMFPGSGSNGPEDWPYNNWAYDVVGRVGKNYYSSNSPQVPPYAAGNDFSEYAQDQDVWLYVRSGDATTWHWTPASNLWQEQATTGSPGALSAASCTYNGSDGNIYCFGGLLGGVYQNALLMYNPATKTWTNSVATSGSTPGARITPGFAWDSARNGILLAGGKGSTVYYTDTWWLDLTRSPPTWTQLSPAGSYAGNASCAAS